MSPNAGSTPKTFYFYILFAMVIWGLSWPTGKIAARYGDPELLLFWRFLLSAVGMVPFLYSARTTLRITPRAIGMILLATLFILAYNYFFFSALAVGLAGVGGVLVTTLNPVLTFMLMGILFRKPLPLATLVGIAIGIGGGCVIMEVWRFSAAELLQSGNLYFLLASLFWALFTIASAFSKPYCDPVSFSFFVFLATGLGALLLPGGVGVLEAFSYGTEFWVVMLFLSVIVTSVATGIYIRATTTIGASAASSFIFLVPLTALLGSVWLLGESPSWTTLLGGALSLGAVYLINRGR